VTYGISEASFSLLSLHRSFALVVSSSTKASAISFADPVKTLSRAISAALRSSPFCCSADFVWSGEFEVDAISLGVAELVDTARKLERLLSPYGIVARTFETGEAAHLHAENLRLILYSSNLRC
jgi:hypothetical protein